MNTTVKAACDFEEPYFGASYPDARCIDGFLWDLDSCDEPGGPLHSGGDVPCPQCNHAAWLETFEDAVGEEGYTAAEQHQPRNYKHKKVRHEQPGDAEKMKAWWLAGYDECLKEQHG